MTNPDPWVDLLNRRDEIIAQWFRSSTDLAGDKLLLTRFLVLGEADEIPLQLREVQAELVAHSKGTEWL
jgi:hypothetical protein